MNNEEYLATITTPELLEEIRKRYAASVILTIKDAKEKDTERFEFAFFGSMTTCLGMIIRMKQIICKIIDDESSGHIERVD